MIRHANTTFVITVVILTLICSSICAEVGEDCVVKTTGVNGVCKISSDCPSVEEQAKRGISPTICGFFELTTPIVCCEGPSEKFSLVPNTLTNFEILDRGFNAEPNDNTFLVDNSPGSIAFPDDSPQPVSNNNLRKSERKCEEYSKTITGVVQAIPLVTYTEPVSIHIEKCDYNSVALIVGGKPASAGEFPYMAALGFVVDRRTEWRCGATLISDQYVLTAAHCTYSRDAEAPKLVRLGDLDLTRTDDGSEFADYNIGKIIVHPSYKFPEKYNDIALIETTKRVKFTKFIRPACLHTKRQIEQRQAIATGWGKTDFTDTESSSKLMKVSLNIYDNSHCVRTYGTGKGIPEGIKSTMLCAGELKGGEDTCQGDSGGPLIITQKSNQCKFYVVGVTSFGKSCGQVNTPAVYTRVSDFVNWIEDTLW